MSDIFERFRSNAELKAEIERLEGENTLLEEQNTALQNQIDGIDKEHKKELEVKDDQLYNAEKRIEELEHAYDDLQDDFKKLKPE